MRHSTRAWITTLSLVLAACSSPPPEVTPTSPIPPVPPTTRPATPTKTPQVESRPKPTATQAAQQILVPTADPAPGIALMPTSCVLPEDLPVDPAGNPQPSTLPDDAKAAYERADAAMKTSDWMEVVAQLSTVIEVAPTHATSHSLLGRAYMKLYEADKSQPKDLGNLRRAFHYLHRSLALHPNNFEGHYNISHAYSLLRDIRPEQADAFLTCTIAHATRSVDLADGKNAAVYKNRGQYYLLVPGNACLAKADFDTALGRAPGYVEIEFYMGDVYAELGDWDQATEKYTLIEQSPKKGPEMDDLKKRVPAAKAKLGTRPATPQITACP